jgi:hypothetical protein
MRLSTALYRKKLDWFAIAARHGLELDLLITPNQVFVEQYQPDLAAELGDERYSGQLLCLSKPAARKIILDNHRALFEMFKSRGLRPASLTACPFDPGGCSCPQCDPWIVTFGRLVKEIHTLANKYFPGIAARLAGWWWTVPEHEQFTVWADREATGLFKSLSMHLKYGQTQPDAGRSLPAGCQPQVFLHIGYADTVPKGTSQGRDVYGIWGPVVAPVRIPATLANMANLGMDGFAAYSEGSFDDLNKAILGGLSSGRFASANDVLAAYVERYFGIAGRDCVRWATWIAQWGRPHEVDVAAARKEWDSLLKMPGLQRSWRTDQLEGKLRLFEAHAAVMRMSQWDDARSAVAEAFFAAREFLYRDVWKIGLTRAGISPEFYGPSWLDEWRQVAKNRSDRPAGETRHEA